MAKTRQEIEREIDQALVELERSLGMARAERLAQALRALGHEAQAFREHDRPKVGSDRVGQGALGTWRHTVTFTDDGDLVPLASGARGNPWRRGPEQAAVEEAAAWPAPPPAPSLGNHPPPTRGAPRSSVRSIRTRQAALRDYNDLVQERPQGPRGDQAARWFLEGFECVRGDVLRGYLPEEALDLSTSIRGVPVAFHDGARAARDLYNSRLPTHGARGDEVPKPAAMVAAERAQAEKLAKAYRVSLPG